MEHMQMDPARNDSKQKGEYYPIFPAAWEDNSHCKPELRIYCTIFGGMFSNSWRFPHCLYRCHRNAVFLLQSYRPFYATCWCGRLNSQRPFQEFTFDAVEEFGVRFKPW